jgi:2-phosphoglycolate phosphatase
MRRGSENAAPRAAGPSDSRYDDRGTPRIGTILFDLDGTLADTAPDLAFALNATLRAYGLPALHFERIRPFVSHGARALVRLGFGLEPGHPRFDEVRAHLLATYQANLVSETRLFAGIAELLATLEDSGLTWGVVTNKPAYLTEPLMQGLGLGARAVCVVSGDTLSERKPHPAPLLHGCRLAGRSEAQCIYVGDAQRDIEAGRRAGMKTLVALYGYLLPGEDPSAWGADGLIHHPMDILERIAWGAGFLASPAPARVR